MASILVVEDDTAIAELVSIHLKMAGHGASVLHDGNEVMRRIEERRPDLIVLDIMLPGTDGLTLMKQIEPLKIPVIFLTAKDRLDDKIAGLKLGADDYIVKPFAAVELVTRIETVLRRCDVAGANIFVLGNLTVKTKERIVTLNGRETELTILEFNLLQTLIDNRNIALSREKLLELVWGYDYMGETRTVDVHIQRLRKKLNMEDSIKTVYKLGYRLEAPR
ncbi:MAG: response regulator transcription factor [Oscillospiraceae bacterium]|jgi:DNA-binding response OmpR family regulator|nr:response regulator transcription factor [Oscillospiraceae bacterium]